MMGYLFSSGIFSRDIKNIAVSLIVFLLYGGAFWGILPGESHISWESHLLGFFAGVMVAWSIHKKE